MFYGLRFENILVDDLIFLEHSLLYIYICTRYLKIYCVVFIHNLMMREDNTQLFGIKKKTFLNFVYLKQGNNTVYRRNNFHDSKYKLDFHIIIFSI